MSGSVCVRVLWACGCCPAENCVYITEYNRNVIPLAIVSPRHMVGTPYHLPVHHVQSSSSSSSSHQPTHRAIHPPPHHRTYPPFHSAMTIVHVCVYIYLYYIYIYLYTTFTYTLIHLYILFATTPAALAAAVFRSLACTHRFVVKPTVLTIDRFPPPAV